VREVPFFGSPTLKAPEPAFSAILTPWRDPVIGAGLVPKEKPRLLTGVWRLGGVGYRLLLAKKSSRGIASARQ
jgi:hypothetical protein